MRSIRQLCSCAVLFTTLAAVALVPRSVGQQIETDTGIRSNPANHLALVGRLEGKSGEPLGGVLVELHTWNGELMSSTVTGTDGAFRFDGVAVGQYLLRGVEGRNSFSENIDFNGSPVPLDVRVGEHSTVVRKEAPANPSEADRVSLNDLAASPAARSKLTKAAKALRENHFQKALRFTDEALKKDGQWARAWLLRGLIHQQVQDFPAARQDFEAATRADPGSGEALAALAETYTRAQDWQKADFYLQRATSIAPNQWQGWFELSRLELLRGNYAAAASSAHRALAATPPAPAGCRYFLGTAEAAMGHLGEAARQFRLFLASNPPPSRAAVDAAHKLQLIEARGGAAAQPAAKQP